MAFIFMIFYILRSSYSYEFFENKGKVKGIHETGQKKEILQFLLVLAEQSAICTTRAPCLASQALSFESAQSLLPLLEQRASVHPLFATSPGIAAAV